MPESVKVRFRISMRLNIDSSILTCAGMSLEEVEDPGVLLYNQEQCRGPDKKLARTIAKFCARVTANQ